MQNGSADPTSAHGDVRRVGFSVVARRLVVGSCDSSDGDTIAVLLALFDFVVAVANFFFLFFFCRDREKPIAYPRP